MIFFIEDIPIGIGYVAVQTEESGEAYNVEENIENFEQTENLHFTQENENLQTVNNENPETNLHDTLIGTTENLLSTNVDFEKQEKENLQTVKNLHSTPVDDLNDILKSVPIEHFVGNEDTNIDTNVDNENLHENFNIDFIVGEDTVETENIMDTSDHNLNNQRSVEDCGLCRFCSRQAKEWWEGKIKKKV